MKAKKILLVLGIFIVLGISVFILYNLRQGKPQEKPIVNKVGLWEDCDPQINNCDTELECSHYYKDIYRCIKFLKEGEECGISAAEICSEGLTCVDTGRTRQRCGTFSTKGEQECFIEPFQVCKRM